MHAVERDLLSALRDLDSAVKRGATGGVKPDLISIFARIDALAAELPADTDPSLVHYLHRKSYEKALAHLNLREVEDSRPL